MIERTGEAFELDEQLTVIGAQLRPGDLAPDFVLEHQNPETFVISPVSLSDHTGSIRVLSMVPSLDTPVCSIQAGTWERLRGELPPEVVLLTVSMDLPYAQSRWQTAQSVSHKAISAHKSEAFAEAYGVLLREWRLLQRSIFVIDKEGRIAYTQYVADQAVEPEYEPAMAAIRALQTGE